MIKLFIENREIELSENIQFAITNQFENLSNPTDIINTWSKTVSIPFTNKNNKIFGHIYCPDRIIVDGGTVGVYFNPLKKLNFRLEWNNNVLMIGYAKLNEVKQVNGSGSYEITLFGELGKVFQEMKKITFDMTSSDLDYIIDGSEYVEEEINKQLVSDSWNQSEQTNNLLKKKTDDNYNVHDIIGFAPNNSFSEGFDYKTFQDTANSSNLFTEILGNSFTQATGIEPDTAIPNGMLPREIGEYRSYYQLPYIYWNKLFQIFQKKSEEVTGYDFELSETWFNQGNPYWYNLVYMLKPLNSIKNITYNNLYSSTVNGDLICYATFTQTGYYFNRYELGMTWDISQEKIPLLINPTDTYPHYFDFNSHQNVDGQISVHIKLDVEYYNLSATTVRIRNKSVFIIDVYMTDEDTLQQETSRIQLGKIAVKYSSSSYVPANVNYVKNVGDISLSGSGTWTLIDDDFSFTIPTDMYNKKYKITWSINGYNSNNNNLSMFVNSSQSTIYLNQLHCYCKPNQLNLNVTPMIGKSYSTFTLNDLWNKDFNLFDEIIKYCKIYRIAISVDDINKKIIFQPYVDYFKNYEIIDWTNKVDYSKDFIIKPVSFENKYILFNYKDSKTKQGEAYKEKYGINYGEYRLITDYNFNTETVNLFKNIVPSIVNTDNVLSWTNLFNYHNITYSFPSEIFVYNKDKDNKQVDIFGSYYFHNGLAYFSDEESLHLRTVYVSDDTTFQQVNNTYFYTQASDATIEVNTYPKLDIVRGNNMCVFNIPKDNYTYINNYSGKSSIYKNIWEKYLNERYNIQNKKITCYVNIKPFEYCSFEWNKFVKIGNQICIVNKIYDYDITDNGTTKVDLITIQDFDGYRTSNYSYDYIISEPNELTIPYNEYKLLTINSSDDWQIKSDDWGDVLVANPEEGNSGITNVIVGSTNEEHGYTLTFELVKDNQIHVNVPCLVGGTPTVSASPWYNSVEIEESATINLTAPNTSWYLYRIDKKGNNNRKVNVSPTSGNGSQNITVTVPADSDTGFVDIYIKDTNSNNLTAFRVDIPNHTLIPSEKLIVMSKNSTKQITITDTSLAGWDLINQTNVTSTTMSPTSGNQGTTTVTFTSNSTTGTDTYTIRNGNMEVVTITVVVCENIAILNSEGTAIQDSDSVEYHGQSSIRGYKVYSTTPWTASLPQGVSSYGATSGDAGVTSVTFDWGSGTPNTTKTITFSNTGGNTCNLSCSYVTE